MLLEPRVFFDKCQNDSDPGKVDAQVNLQTTNPMNDGEACTVKLPHRSIRASRFQNALFNQFHNPVRVASADPAKFHQGDPCNDFACLNRFLL
jgi:hypothetical protein